MSSARSAHGFAKEGPIERTEVVRPRPRIRLGYQDAEMDIRIGRSEAGLAVGEDVEIGNIFGSQRVLVATVIAVYDDHFRVMFDPQKQT